LVDPTSLRIVETLPNAVDYNRLRTAVGWSTPDLAVIERALPNSLYAVCAYVDGSLAGMARVVGDGGLAYYIQDVIVLPGYQLQGIGSRLMDHIMAYIHAHASRDTTVGLISAVGKEWFFENYGFITRPTDKLGAGMTSFWQPRVS
jgi:ribosomal protein S18 acetylase RimI-like enzyme